MFKDCSAEEEAREMAASSILEMAGKRLPVHQPDQDEPIDSVELNGYSVVREDVPSEPTDCLSCLLKSEECGHCDRNTNEDDGDRIGIGIIFIDRPTPSFIALFRSRHEALDEVYSSAPASRGSRALGKVCVPGRVRIL